MLLSLKKWRFFPYLLKMLAVWLLFSSGVVFINSHHCRAAQLQDFSLLPITKCAEKIASQQACSTEKTCCKKSANTTTKELNTSDNCCTYSTQFVLGSISNELPVKQLTQQWQVWILLLWLSVVFSVLGIVFSFEKTPFSLVFSRYLHLFPFHSGKLISISNACFRC
ncbi:MAG: hypothetical protein R2798_12365 [Chitinophagales bacterium]|nr:hypothetical protein [Bacteroidota bacterium]MCB9043044.1 hypothetical protein [Chitinophagales bacterium]